MRRHLQSHKTLGHIPEMEYEGLRRVLQTGRVREKAQSSSHFHLRPTIDLSCQNPSWYVADTYVTFDDF